MTPKILIFIIFCSCFFTLILSDDYDKDYDDDDSNPYEDADNGKCAVELKFGVDWLLSIYDKNSGWGEDTHRAIITIFTNVLENKTSLDPWQIKLMKAQLNVQLSLFILKNSKNKVEVKDLPEGDLALYIHALLVTGQNPLNYNGMNLVELLEKTTKNSIHPFSVLCLCNANAVTPLHLGRIERFLNLNRTFIGLEMTALALTAFACASTLGITDKLTYDRKMITAAQNLASLERLKHEANGKYGNIFTTALVIHALKSVNYQHYKIEDITDQFLRNEETKIKNIAGIYYIERALRNKPFIKDIMPPFKLEKLGFHSYKQTMSVHYSLITKENSVLSDTLELVVPVSTSIFDIMKFAAAVNHKFKFSYRLQRDVPIIYSISGVPNNIEDGSYWKLLLFNDKNVQLNYNENTSIKDLTMNNGYHLKYEYANRYSYKG